MQKPLYNLNPDESIPYLQDYFFPPYITLAHLFHAPHSWGVKPRSFKQSQLQFVVSGKAEYTIENRDYETGPGDLLLHYPNERHAVSSSTDEPYVCISIVFHFGNTAFSLKNLMKNTHFFGNFKDHSIEKQLYNIIVNYRQPGTIHQLQCQAMLLNILTELYQSLFGLTTDTLKKNKTISKMILVKNYISNHYKRDIRLEELEQVSGLSRNYLIQQFKKEFGISPIQYMNWLRVEKAKELYVQSHLSISEIAREIGYADVHTFGRMFKRKTGCSLSQFCTTLFTGNQRP